MDNTFFRLVPAVALCLPLLSLAQASRPDPTDSKAPAPALRYQSAFSEYKLWQDIKPGDWRQLNDNVAPKNGKGGVHADHDSAPAPGVPAAKASAPAASAAGAHQGHHMHGGQK